MAEQDAAEAAPIASPPAAPAAPQQRNFEDVFKPQSRAFDSVFKPRPEASQNFMPMNFDSEQWGQYLHAGTTGAVIRAFGNAFSGPGIREDELEFWDKNQLGMQKELSAAFGEGFARPAANFLRSLGHTATILPAAGLDLITRSWQALTNLPAEVGESLEGPNSMFPGGAAAARALDIKGLGREAAGFMEMLGTWGHIVPGGGVRLPSRRPGVLPEQVAAPRAETVIGEGESGYYGTRPPTEEMLAERRAADADVPVEAPPAAAEAPKVEPIPEPGKPPTLDEVARAHAPEVFSRWDSLKTRRDTYARWIPELRETAVREIEANPPEALQKIDRDIAALESQGPKAGRGGRESPIMQERFEAQLADLRMDRQNMLEDLTREHPYLARVRREYQAADLKMRDMAGEVRDATREAEALMPPEEAVAGAPEPVQREAAAAVAEGAGEPGAAPAAPGAGEMVRAPDGAPDLVETVRSAPRHEGPTLLGEAREAAARGPTTSPEQVNAIRADVIRKLLDFGKPMEQATANAEIVAAYYDTWAQRLGGRLGSAEEMYRAGAPRMVREREAEFAQPGRRGAELEQPAYHGSPFKFDQFTLDHIGKGEGAQAFGHGLYFAGNKEVARYYREALSIGQGPDIANTIAKKVLGRDLYDLGGGVAGDVWRVANDEKLSAEQGAKQLFARNSVLRKPDQSAAIPDPDLVKLINEIRAEGKPGRLYHVELAPKETEWLDWDKPLSEQSEHVRAVLKTMGIEEPRGLPAVASPSVENILKAALKANDGDPRNLALVIDNDGALYQRAEKQMKARGLSTDDISPGEFIEREAKERIDALKARKETTGEAIYRQISERFAKRGDVDESGMKGWTQVVNTVNDAVVDPAAASAALKKAGIPGIRYLDHGSRDSGQGSHNFVVFDAADVAITQFEQAGRGGISGVFQDGPRILRMAASSDASTFIHETAHTWLEDLMRFGAIPESPADVKADAQAVRDWLGVKDVAEFGAKNSRGQFTKAAVKANEKFARGFERYMMEGRAPSRALDRVFSQFREWLTKIYQTISRLKAPINDDIRAVFDRFLSTAPERSIIAAEAEIPKRVGEAHGALAESTKPPEAAAALARAQAEFDEQVRARAQEIEHELKLGGTGRPGETQRKGPDGGGDAAGPGAGPKGGLPGPAGERAGPGPARPESTAKSREPRLPLTLKVPKQPLRLEAFVKSKGGVQDPGGDLKAITGGGRSRLINKNGLARDDMAESAWENGYFPDFAERPSWDDLLRRLEDDIRGNPQYSEFDSDAVAAYTNALEHNAEIDRLAQELDIETKGLSYNEFWDKVAERKSLEDLGKDIEAQEASFTENLANMERMQEEWLAERPESWEPDALEPGPARSLEDLEREYQQEIASRSAGQGQEAVGPIERPGESPGGGESGFTVGRDGAGDAGRQEPAPARYRADPELVDKAGNIRLENLTTIEDVKAAIRDAAEATGGFMEARRGKMTWAELMDLADDMGVRPAFLDQWKVGQAWNHEQIWKARQVLREQAAKVQEAKAKAAVGNDADVMAYAAEREQFLMIAKAVSGVTAEWGRGGSALRRMMEGQGEVDQLAEFFQSATGRTVDDFRREAQMALPLNDARAAAKFLMSSVQPNFWDMLIEYRQAAMLWSPRSWARNIIGGVLAIASEIPTHALTVGFGKIRELGGDTAPRATAREIVPSVFALVNGTRNGLRAAKAIMADETVLDRAHSRSEFGFDIGRNEIGKDNKRVRAIPGKVGELARGSFRIMGASDAVFKGMAYEVKFNQLAIRQAMSEGLTGEALTTRVTDLLQSPTADMMVESKKYSEYQTFNQDLNGVLKELQTMIAKHPSLRLLIPFMRTPVNILKYSAERSPFAFFVKEARENLMGQHGAIARDEALARIAVGSLIGVGAWSLVQDGTITGGGPTDPRERAVKYASGWKPYSARIGDFYYSYTGFEPISTLFGVTADMHEISDKITDEQADHVGKMVFAAITKNFINKTYMSGLSDFFEAINDPERYGEDWAGRLAGSFVPSGVAQIAQSQEPYMRDAQTFTAALRDRVGMAWDTMPSRDIFGEPIPRGDALGPDFASPFFMSKLVNDPVVQEFERLGIFPAAVPKKIRDVELTPQQLDDFRRIAGRTMKIRLDAMVNAPGWLDAPGHIRRRRIEQVVEHSREQARSYIMATSRGGENDIMQKALEFKRDLATGLDAKGNR